MGRKGRAPIGPKLGPAAAATEDAAEGYPVSKAAEVAQSAREWWHDLKEDDPITLEPLACLDIPPFGLQASDATTHYFDPVALASYITRRAVFQNPLNRKPLTGEECVRLDRHIEQHAPFCRNFRVADALELQRAIRDKISSGSDRSAATRRRDANAALSGLFSSPSLQEAQALTATRGSGGWAVVDDDFQRQIEAEAIAAMHAATAAEAARTGGAVPEASTANFPELSEEALFASERLAAVVVEGDGYAQAAQALADQAAREAQIAAIEAAARRAAAKEAAERMHAAKSAAKARTLQIEKQREVLQAEAAVRKAEHAAAVRQELDNAKAEELKATAAASLAAAERKRAVEEAEASKKAAEEKLEADEDLTEKLRREEEDKQIAEERKKQKEAEKKQRQKEKKRLEKEKAAAEQARLELEAAKSASALRCALCGGGIIGKNFFNVNEQKFCSMACVKKKKAEGS